MQEGSISGYTTCIRKVQCTHVHMYMYMNDVIVISYPVWPVLLVPGHLCRTVREDKLTGKKYFGIADSLHDNVSTY